MRNLGICQPIETGTELFDNKGAHYEIYHLPRRPIIQFFYEFD